MMRKCMAVLMTACLLAVGVSGVAQEALELAAYEEPLYLFGHMKPLDDGRLLMYGTAYYPDTNRRYPDVWEDGYDEYILLNEGYLALLDADGKVQWKLRYGEPVAQNYMYPMGILPDGHLLVTLRVYETVAGSQFFKVNMENGRIEGMLPNVEVAKMVPPLTMEMLSDGYIGGGFVPVDDTFLLEYNQFMDEAQAGYEHFSGMALRRLDWDLKEKWSLDLSEYTGWPDYTARELRNGDILLFGYQRDDLPSEWIASLLRVDGRTGEVLWHSIGDKALDAGPVAVVELADGNLLLNVSLLREGTQEGRTDPGMLCMDAQGNTLWQKVLTWEGIDEREWYLGELVPFADGYAALAWTFEEGAGRSKVLYMDSEGEVKAELDVLEPDNGNDLDWVNIAASDNGEHVYVHGQERMPFDPDGRSNMAVGIRYVKLTEEMFGITE